MKLLKCIGIGVAALSLSTACAPAPGGSVGLSAESATIINGVKVGERDLVTRSTVGIVTQKNKEQGICTGTLIHPGIVLTAAHCVDQKPDIVAVIFTTDFARISQENIRRVTDIEIHPDWAPSENATKSKEQADIALIKFDGDTPDGYVAAKPLTEKIKFKEGSEFVVAGYGIDDAKNQTGAGVLRKTKLKLLGAANETQLVSDGSKTSICFGDSGGPAYVQHRGRLYFWGVAHAVTTKLCNQYVIHTFVFSYGEWLSDTADRLAKN